MSESYPLPTEPEDVIPSLLKRFNSGKIEVMMALYAPEAVFVVNRQTKGTPRIASPADVTLMAPLPMTI
jgi:hypothetical protein